MFKASSSMHIRYMLVLAMAFLSLPVIKADAPLCEIVLSSGCYVRPLYGNKEIESFVKATLEKERLKDFGDTTEMNERVREITLPNYIFIEDLNNDNIPEYIVPIVCGAVGNCRYIIFTDHPARIVADFHAQFILYMPQANGWPDITAYCHDSASSGNATTYSYQSGFYRETESIFLLDGVSNGRKVDTFSPFMKRISSGRCSCSKES